MTFYRLFCNPSTQKSIWRRSKRFMSITKKRSDPMPSVVSDFIDFISDSPSPFHAVHQAKRRLLAAGFKEIKEKESWNGSICPNGKYFFTRNQSAIVAFAVGGKYECGNGFAIIGAHTDSPCLKVKPISNKEKMGYIQVGVEVYGGGLWHTWFDRDLGLAGRVMIDKGDGTFEHRLVRIHRPILRIPTLAIHLDRTVNDGFQFNKETQLTPVLALAASQALNEPTKKAHSSVLLDLLVKELNVKEENIADFELCLYEVSNAVLGGANEEFIFSARLDNICMSYCALSGLIGSLSLPQTKLADDPSIRIITLFDNEEVGSQSANGADSNLLAATLKRIVGTQVAGSASSKDNDVVERAMLKSFLVSADMAHAIHPNYADKHEENHRPHMNKGIVIKQNANQRYATTSVTSLLLKEVAKVKNIPLQEFVVRNDSPCGSTIGPILASNLGIRTVDIGNPQLSMHSIREQCGAKDVQYAIDLFEEWIRPLKTLGRPVFEESPKMEIGHPILVAKNSVPIPPRRSKIYSIKKDWPIEHQCIQDYGEENDYDIIDSLLTEDDESDYDTPILTEAITPITIYNEEIHSRLLNNEDDYEKEQDELIQIFEQYMQELDQSRMKKRN